MLENFLQKNFPEVNTSGPLIRGSLFYFVENTISIFPKSHGTQVHRKW